MCKDAKGIHYTCGNSFMKQILKGVGSIFYHIMQKACHLFLVCMAHQAHYEWMKDNRIAIGDQVDRHGLTLPYGVLYQLDSLLIMSFYVYNIVVSLALLVLE